MRSFKWPVLCTFFLLTVTLLVKCTFWRTENCNNFSVKYSELTNGKSLDTVQAMRLIDKILQRDPKCIDALLTKGDLLISKNMFSQARKNYTEVNLADTSNAYALYKIGVTFQLDNDDDSAILFFEKALAKKRHGNAIIDYPKTNEQLSTEKNKYDIPTGEILFREGISLYYNKTYQSAVDNFNFCISHNYLLDKSFLYRGAIYMEIDQKERACQDFADAKKLGNKDAQEYLNKYCSK